MIFIKIKVTASKTKSHILLETLSFSWCPKHFTFQAYNLPLLHRCTLLYQNSEGLEFPPEVLPSIFSLYLHTLLRGAHPIFRIYFNGNSLKMCMFCERPASRPQTHMPNIVLDSSTYILQRNLSVTMTQAERSIPWTLLYPQPAPHFRK